MLPIGIYDRVITLGHTSLALSKSVYEHVIHDLSVKPLGSSVLLVVYKQSESALRGEHKLKINVVFRFGEKSICAPEEEKFVEEESLVVVPAILAKEKLGRINVPAKRGFNKAQRKIHIRFTVVIYAQNNSRSAEASRRFNCKYDSFV